MKRTNEIATQGKSLCLELDSGTREQEDRERKKEREREERERKERPVLVLFLVRLENDGIIHLHIAERVSSPLSFVLTQHNTHA